MTIYGYRTLAEASLDLSRQIVNRYGADAAVPDFLQFGAKVTPHEGSDRKGSMIFAYPHPWSGNVNDMMMAYYGDLPAGLEAAK